MVICTGFKYSQPFKDDSLSLADRKKNLESWTDKVTKAQSILVVGGNVVGVEMAGELAFNNP